MTPVTKAGASSTDLEILILAPTGQDAMLLSEVLTKESLLTSIFSEIAPLCARARRGGGAILIAEEALPASALSELNEVLQQQEPWSDIPVIVMTSGGRSSLPTSRILSAFAASGNVNLIERPFSPVTLVSTLKVALRARSRQYQVRDLLEFQRTATRLRDEFISVASHELKTPLTSMKLQTELGLRMKATSVPTEERAEKLTQILRSNHSQVNKLVRLVDDMLDTARIGAGAFRMHKSEFDLSELVRDLVDLFRPILSAAGCELHLEAEKRLVGTWDRFRIEQVISNLFTNAARYAAGAPVRVSISRRGDSARLVVQDEGKGIAPENREKIFERFERATEGKGLGLGLYICRQIVTDHQGTIHVESELGKGSSFIVELPLHIP